MDTDPAELQYSIDLSFPFQDLSNDPLLKNASREIVQGVGRVPALGGIPLLARLGKGRMGTVYYCIQPGLDLEVVIRIFPFKESTPPDHLEKFRTTAEQAVQVKSAHLVGLNDVREENGIHFVVMDFIRGMSAAEFLDHVKSSGRSGTTEATALEICMAAANGLAVAHQQKLCHRDVRLKTILIPRAEDREELLPNQAKLSDLGLVTPESEAQGGQDTGSDASGRQADIQALGACLCGLLSGREADEGAGVTEQAMSKVSEQTKTLIGRCQTRNRQEWFADANELMQALSSCREALGNTQEADAQAELAVACSALRPRVPLSLSVSPDGEGDALGTGLAKQGTEEVRGLSTLGMQGRSGGSSLFSKLIVLILILCLGYGVLLALRGQSQQVSPGRDVATLRIELDGVRHADWSDEKTVEGLISDLKTLKKKYASLPETELKPLLELLYELEWHATFLRKRRTELLEQIKEVRRLTRTDPVRALDLLNEAEVFACEDPSRQAPNILESSVPDYDELHEALEAAAKTAQEQRQKKVYAERMREGKAHLAKKEWMKAMTAFQQASEARTEDMDGAMVEEGLRAAREGLTTEQK